VTDFDQIFEEVKIICSKFIYLIIVTDITKIYIT